MSKNHLSIDFPAEAIPHSPEEIQRLAWDSFKEALPELLVNAPGKWVVFRGDEQIILADNKQEVYEQIESRKIPLNEIVVRKVERIPPPLDLRRVLRTRRKS